MNRIGTKSKGFRDRAGPGPGCYPSALTHLYSEPGVIWASHRTAESGNSWEALSRALGLSAVLGSGAVTMAAPSQPLEMQYLLGCLRLSVLTSPPGAAVRDLVSISPPACMCTLTTRSPSLIRGQSGCSLSEGWFCGPSFQAMAVQWSWRAALGGLAT